MCTYMYMYILYIYHGDGILKFIYFMYFFIFYISVERKAINPLKPRFWSANPKSRNLFSIYRLASGSRENACNFFNIGIFFLVFPENRSL